MILELGIGDAYGAGFEYVDRSMVRNHNDLSGYVSDSYMLPGKHYYIYFGRRASLKHIHPESTSRCAFSSPLSMDILEAYQT